MDNIFIDIKDISNRIARLSENANNKSNTNVKSCYKKLMESRKFNVQLMNICVENWTLLDSNNEKSFEMLIDVFEHACLSEGITNSLISHYCNIICESAIPKVRDGKQAQSYINRNLGRLKSKLSTRINNNINDVKNAVSNSINSAKNNLNNNVNNIKGNVNKSLGTLNSKQQDKKEEEKNEKIMESFERFYNSSNVLINYDRVIDNYNKISKRFNVDRLLYESIDIQDFITEYCRLVDTYSISNTNKFIITTETAMYTLEKNHLKYNRSDILKYTSDYYISKEDCSISDIKSALDSAFFYDPKKGDMKDIEYITEYEPDTDDENDELEENSNYNTYNLDYIIESGTKKKSTAKDIFNKFKELPNKTLESLKTAIKRMYTSSDTMIIEEVPNILSYIRTVFVAGAGFAINPIVGVVVFIADQAIALNFKRNETKKLIDKYEKEKEKTEKKISKLEKDSSTKKRYEEYLKSLEKSIDKLETYYKDLLTDDEIEKREEEKYSKNMDKAADDFDVDFTIDDDEWKIENVMTDIADKMKFINEHPLSDSINKISTDLVLKTNCDSIDIVTEFVLNYGTSNDIFCLKNIFENSKKESRRDGMYILTDCLNENIIKLSSNNTKDVNTFDIFNAYCEFVTIINDITSLNSDVFIETSFANNIILASEKLRKSMIKMTDAEKNASKNVDITLNNMKKAAERAMENDNREAIIKGSILPSASKMIKITLTSGIVALFNPVIATIGLLGYIGCSAKMKAKERQMILDEIEIELKMVDKYLKIADDENDLKAQRELLKTQRQLERQYQRIKYKMKVEFDQDVPDIKSDEDY